MSNTRTWSKLKAEKMSPEQIAKSEAWAQEESARLSALDLPLLNTHRTQIATRQNSRERFITAIRARRYLEIGYVPTRGDARHATVIPLDFGPSRKAADKSDRYHMWDVRRNHVLSILPTQLLSMEESELEHATFDPETVVTWCTKQSPWFVQREWGSKS